MRNIFLLLILLAFTAKVSAQEQKTVMLSGASFGVKENGWFELACDAFRVNAINKAISGESIKDAAKRLYNGTFYSNAELKATDVLVLMHVHNQDVANTANLKDDYTQYTYDEISGDYAIAYDYVIKKYKADCLTVGKEAKIVLCTHWHDARTIYNPAIRVLAQKWDLPLVKWDENIGFTKDILDANGKQPSLKYAQDTETIQGVTYGWHPQRGKDKYIQQKIAEIFVLEMQNILGVIPVTATVTAKNNVIKQGEDAYLIFSFTGLAPWNFSYKVGDEQFDLDGITQTPLAVKVDVPTGTEVKVTPLTVSNGTEPNGTVSGPISIKYMDKSISPFFDTFVHQTNNTTSYQNEQNLDLKIINSDRYSREIFISFKLDQLDTQDKNIALRLFFDQLIYSGTVTEESHLIEVFGNTNSYTTMTWNNKPTNMEKIGEVWVLPSEKKSYIGWDVSEWTQKQIVDGKTQVTFQLKVISGGSGLLRFPSIEGSANKPEILTAQDMITGINNAEKSDNSFKIYPNPFVNSINIKNAEKGNVSIYSVDGKNFYQKTTDSNGDINIQTEDFPSGIYFVRYESAGNNFTQKLIKK